MLPRAIARRYAVAAGHSRERLLTEPTADFARPVMARQPMALTCRRFNDDDALERGLPCADRDPPQLLRPYVEPMEC